MKPQLKGLPRPHRAPPTLMLVNLSKVAMPRKWIGQVYSFLRPELNLQGGLTVVFLDVAPARKLNLKFRNKNYATDVLSFVGSGPEEFGELVICPQVLKAQAKDHGLTFKAELSYMLIHGVLHLLGYDHERSQKEEKEMFRIQDQLFDRLCIKFQIEPLWE